jgi:hypothetical protein
MKGSSVTENLPGNIQVISEKCGCTMTITPEGRECSICPRHRTGKVLEWQEHEKIVKEMLDVCREQMWQARK